MATKTLDFLTPLDGAKAVEFVPPLDWAKTVDLLTPLDWANRAGTTDPLMGWWGYREANRICFIIALIFIYQIRSENLALPATLTLIANS